MVARQAQPPLDLPEAEALRPGQRYTWSLACTSAAGPRIFDADFEVASTEERAAFESARAAIERIADGRVQQLVLAQHALRLGYLGEAERAARQHLRDHPGDELGRRTLALVFRRLGSAEPVP
jgi:hypothetical protein